MLGEGEGGKKRAHQPGSPSGKTPPKKKGKKAPKVPVFRTSAMTHSAEQRRKKNAGRKSAAETKKLKEREAEERREEEERRSKKKRTLNELLAELTKISEKLGGEEEKKIEQEEVQNMLKGMVLVCNKLIEIEVEEENRGEQRAEKQTVSSKAYETRIEDLKAKLTTLAEEKEEKDAELRAWKEEAEKNKTETQEKLQSLTTTVEKAATTGECEEIVRTKLGERIGGGDYEQPMSQEKVRTLVQADLADMEARTNERMKQEFEKLSKQLHEQTQQPSAGQKQAISDEIREGISAELTRTDTNLNQVKQMTENLVVRNEEYNRIAQNDHAMRTAVSSLEVSAEQAKQDSLRGHYELSADTRKTHENLASVKGVRAALGQGADTRDRNDQTMTEQLRKNIVRVLQERHNTTINQDQVTTCGWKGRNEDSAYFTIGDMRTNQRVSKGIRGKWGSDQINGYVNQELTFERKNLKKCLRLGQRRHKTIKKVWEEENGVFHYTMHQGDERTRPTQDRIQVKDGRLDVWVTPCKQNNCSMMKEADLLEAIHLVGEAGERLDNAKNTQGIRVAQGYNPPRD